MTAFGIFLLLSSVPLSAFIAGVGIHRSPGKFDQYIYVYIWVMAMLAYNCIPNYENDLIRYFYMIEESRKLTFGEWLILANDGLIIKNLLFWVIGRIGDKHLLPALASGIYYGIGAKIAKHTLNEKNTRIEDLILFELLAIPFLESLSNVRNVMAFSLLVYAVYRDFVLKNRNILTVLLYIMPCFIHMAGFILILVRFAVWIVRRRPAIGILSMFLVPSIPIIVFRLVGDMRNKLPGNVGKILSRAVVKAYNSTMNASEYAQRVNESGYFNSCRFIMFIMLACIAALTIKYILHMRQMKEYGKADYAIFNLLLCNIALAWILMGTVKYWVFAFSVVISCVPVLAYYISNLKTQGTFTRYCIYGIQLSAALRFGLELYYISSRILVRESIQGLILNNFFVVFGKNLKGLFI